MTRSKFNVYEAGSKAQGPRSQVWDVTCGRRSGITLVEVLISMFVALIGLVSLASLITLGRFEMLEGTKADRAMSVARAAVREIKVRGYLHPIQTTTAGATTPMWFDAGGTPTPFPSNATNLALALDPLGMSFVGNGANAATFPPGFLNTGPGAWGSSPSPGSGYMRRINVLGFPGAAAPLSASAADAIFRCQDDLLLNNPVGDFPPTQGYTSGAARRQSQGDYSWMATIDPSRNGDAQMARVSIVVFYKRNLLLPASSLTTQSPPERMVTLTPAAGNTGLAGGEVILSTAPTAGLSADYVKVRPNQWILLSQAPSTDNPVSIPAWYRWYRVAATSEPVNNSNIWARNVTLAGPDWKPNKTDPGNGNAPIPTFASIFDGVIAVYERNIELEETGTPWSPN